MEAANEPNAAPASARADIKSLLTESKAATSQEDSTPTPALKSEDTTEDKMAPAASKSQETEKEKEKDKDKDTPMYTATTTTTRRNANGSVSSVYSGNKIRHLKKEDGVPLWRKDIQYDFLKFVFEDNKKVFHKASDSTSGHTFADIYLDAMAKSSKCSKILKDKLLTERAAAINMAMVCLLVNVGRMNTTLNFFPEMRAQLRTYHSIPSLQAQQDPNAYKQLQDAPRLKSILKGATEDVEQPSTLEDIKAHAIPRTNPVNLIFVLAQFAPKISEIHFDVPRDFFDLVMKSCLSSESRATAFLWLMWWYLESDFSEGDALNNPYGAGRYGSKGRDDELLGGLPLKCPAFVVLTDEQADKENVDTDAEKDFGEQKRKERLAILATDMAPVVTGPKRNPRKGYPNTNPVFSVASDNDGTATPARDYHSPAPSHTAGARSSGRKHIAQSRVSITEYHSDSDRTRSASPPSRSLSKTAPGMRIGTMLNEDSPSTPQSASGPTKGPGRGNWRRNRQSDADGPSLSGPHGYYLPLNGSDPSLRRTNRPLTAHQLAVERYRKQKVEHILAVSLLKSHASSSKKRKREGPFIRAWRRMRSIEGGMASWDSEEEGGTDENGYGVENSFTLPGGQMGLVAGVGESDDWGEEATLHATTFRRLLRRGDRWEKGLKPVPRKRRKEIEEEEEEEEEKKDLQANDDGEDEGEGEGEGEVEGDEGLGADDEEDEDEDEELAAA